jgi:hypothetical protein
MTEKQPSDGGSRPAGAHHGDEGGAEDATAFVDQLHGTGVDILAAPLDQTLAL